jgi:hypothetical protein
VVDNHGSPHLRLLLLLSWPAGPLLVRSVALPCLLLPSAAWLLLAGASWAAAMGACLLLQAVVREHEAAQRSSANMMSARTCM